MKCPKCGSENVDVTLVQENQATVSATKTKSKYKQKEHGLLWWLCIGWWWWMVDIMIWIFAFVPRLIIQLCKKKKYVGDSSSVTTTKNITTYESMCLCKGCGYHWEQSQE